MSSPDTRRVINWTPAKLEALQAAYNTAVRQRVTKFTVTIDKIDTEFDTGYAKYMIEYLTGEFKKRGVPTKPQNTGEESTSASSTDEFGSNF